MDRAEVEWLWIAENKPDTFSKLIQWWFDTPYSHCAIRVIHTGMIWHATTSSDKKKCGVIEEAPSEAMVGCHVAASIIYPLNCTPAELDAFLETERGKPYAHRGNIGLVIDKMILRPLIRLVSQFFRPHADAERNCSEFAGFVFHKKVRPLKGARDKWTPPLLEQWLKPKRHV